MKKENNKLDRFKWKQNTNGFAKNKKNINKKGAPRKLLTDITANLKKEWVNRVNKSEIEELLSILFNLNETQLQTLVEWKETPMILRIIIESMLSPRGFDTINSLLDRVFWKASQTNNNINIETTEEVDVLKERLKCL